LRAARVRASANGVLIDRRRQQHAGPRCNMLHNVARARRAPAQRSRMNARPQLNEHWPAFAARGGTADSKVLTACCTLQLNIACCMCMSHVACRTLHVACRMLHVAPCTVTPPTTTYLHVENRPRQRRDDTARLHEFGVAGECAPEDRAVPAQMQMWPGSVSVRAAATQMRLVPAHMGRRVPFECAHQQPSSSRNLRQTSFASSSNIEATAHRDAETGRIGAGSLRIRNCNWQHLRQGCAYFGRAASRSLSRAAW
jgi:hypothetical protein